MKKGITLSILISLFFLPIQNPAEGATLFFEKDGIKVGYDNGFLIKAKDQFEMKFGAWIQFQHEYIDKEIGTNTSSFKVAKGRLRWSGFMYSPKFAYVIQLELADPNNADGTKDVSLKDFAIDIKHYQNVKVRLGQFKVPFNRQQMAFFGDLQFVDTSLASKNFNANQVNARDIGIMMSGSRDEQHLQYFVGFFNGNGINQASNNDTTQYLSVVRIVFNPFGKMSISESDIENTRQKLLSVGGGFAYDAGKTDGGTPGSARTFALEAAFKHQGRSLQGEFYSRHIKGNTNARGFYLQGGIFIVPEKTEVAVRYAVLDPEGGKNNQEEVTLGLNIFFAGHRRKLQIDLSNISNDADNTDDQRIRTQYQISF